MSSIVKYETKVNEILRAKQNRIDSLGKMITETRQKMDEIEGQMREAVKAGDTQGHVDLSFQRDKVEKELKALRLQKDILVTNEDPLITDEEYKTGIREIMLEVDGINKRDKKELLSLIHQISEIGERNKEIMNRADAVLSDWQEKIYMNLDRKLKLNNGRVILMAMRAEVKDRSVTNFSRQLCNGSYAKMFQEQVGGEQ